MYFLSETLDIARQKRYNKIVYVWNLMVTAMCSNFSKFKNSRTGEKKMDNLKLAQILLHFSFYYAIIR